MGDEGSSRRQDDLAELADAGLSRGELLARATLLAGAAVLGDLPRALRLRGLLDVANAQTPGLVEQTINGLVAFVVPGRDRYSAAQGRRSARVGGIEAGTTPALIRTLNRFLPTNPPLSTTAATLLNQFAVTINPRSARGRFASPFANLPYAQKARVFQALEGLSGPEAGSIRFLAGNLPALAAFLAYSEAGVWDARRRRVRRRPVGWRISRYTGVSDGRPELKGYFQGRRRADP